MLQQRSNARPKHRAENVRTTKKTKSVETITKTVVVQPSSGLRATTNGVGRLFVSTEDPSVIYFNNPDNISVPLFGTVIGAGSLNLEEALTAGNDADEQQILNTRFTRFSGAIIMGKNAYADAGAANSPASVVLGGGVTSMEAAGVVGTRPGIAIGGALPGFSGARAANGGVAIGTGETAAGAKALGTASVAIGSGTYGRSGAIASGVASIALGSGSAGTGDFSISIGASSSATAAGAVAIGTNAAAQGSDSIAVGLDAVAAGAGSIAIGELAAASAQNAIAIQKDAVASGENSIAVGLGAAATATRAIAIGKNATSAYTDSISLGLNAKCTAANQFTVNFTGSALDATFQTSFETTTSIPANGSHTIPAAAGFYRVYIGGVAYDIPLCTATAS